MERRAPVHVGSPPRNEAQPWKVTPVQFHGFEGLDAARGSLVESPEFECLGHKWLVKLYPGGDHDSEIGMVGLYLTNRSEVSDELHYGLSVVNSSGFHAASCGYLGVSTFGPGESRGSRNFVKRSDIMEALVNGSLFIEVRIRSPGTSPLDLPITSERTLCQTMQKLFGDEESADVTFEIEDDNEQVGNKRKRTKSTHTKIHAHRLILKKCAPDLDALCESAKDNDSVPIAGVKPDIFRHMLFYVYGGAVANEDLRSHSKEIIDAADKYGVVNLKLQAEAWYVNSTEITVENVMKLLLYADAKNCALLKEAVMDFMVQNHAAVIRQVPLRDAPEGLLAELLAAVARKDSKVDDNDDLSTMRVNDLRKMLLEKGLNCDGSRETMIATLKENA
ncbi:hypothetical protein ACHAWF_004927 [Thalassiosira exigua]